MKLRNLLLSLVYMALLGCSSGDDSSSGQVIDPADTVYLNGKIYTVDDSRPWAEAVAIKDGKFLKVGSAGEMKAVTGESTEVVDLAGNFAMPGLVDAHIHPHFVSLQAAAGNLQFAPDLDADGIAKAIREYAAANPDKKWIRGGQYGFGAFEGAKMTREWLDKVVPDRPAFMEDESGHNFTANTLALEIAGITAETPNPPLGNIDKDPETGEPTGYLSEWAISLVGEKLDRVSQQAFDKAIRESLGKMTPWGITSFIDMASTDQVVAVYKNMEAKGELPFRVNTAIMLNEYSGEFWSRKEALAFLHSARELSTEQVRTDQFKIWADGTPLSYTSLMVEPYTNKDTHGELTITDEMRETVIELLGQGYSGHAHAIGDGTVRWTLDLVEEARQRYPGKVKRYHMAHNHLVKPVDLKRYVELDVVAEVSPPQWFPFAATPLVVDFLGQERYDRWMDVRAMLDNGLTVAYGSDWPTGSPTGNPFRGMEALVTRAHPDGEFEGTWGTPISVDEMLKSATMGGAHTMQREDTIGSITVGKYADMIVLDQNLHEVDPSLIGDTKVLKTIFNGRVVYEAQ